MKLITEIETPSQSSSTSQIITIKVHSAYFEPANIICTTDTIIRWLVVPNKEQNSKSLYYGATRGHAIGFDQIDAESPYLDINHSYELKFHQPGIYNYKCLIFGDMKGSVEVLPKDDYPINLEDIERAKSGARSIYSVSASTDIERPEEKLELINKEENIKKIVDKYMKKARWELPEQLAIEIDKIEKDIPFFKEGKKAEMITKKKRNRNRRRRHTRAKNVLIQSWNEESKLFKHLLRINYSQMWNRQDKVKEINNEVQISRVELVKSCMDYIP